MNNDGTNDVVTTTTNAAIHMDENEDHLENNNGVEDELKGEASLSTSTTVVADAPPQSNSSRWCSPSLRQKIVSLYWEQEFLILIVISILLAKAYPPLGAKYLQPDITSTWIAVVIIFLAAGLSLKTSEFTKALMNWQYNLLIQLFNFGVVSSIVYGVSRGLQQSNIIGTDLANGMVVCACMPMTISTVVVLTKAADGDEASSVFNSAIGNVIGVFLTPLLILGYLGVTGDIDLVKVFYQLALRVLLPGFIGQILQRIASVQEFVKTHKFFIKQLQTYSLVFIVYTVFCETFSDDTGSSVGDVFLMIVFQLILLIIVMILAWYMLRVLYPNNPKLRVAGLYCCTHKTAAVGIPLITAIYSNSLSNESKVGLYTLPLLIWHPLQLIIGTLLAPRLVNFVKVEEIRLNRPANIDDTNAVNLGSTTEDPNMHDDEDGMDTEEIEEGQN
jgi:solute carrier family 10 (sodium/bile acid cotransporter), member 7